MSVYFITAREVGKVKIGCAFNPAQRLAHMQTMSPCDLVWEAVLPGAYEQERELHKLFADERVRGEWFILTEEIEAVIAANRAPRQLSEEEMRRLMPTKAPRDDRDRDELQEIRKRLARGDIHFPFREQVPA